MTAASSPARCREVIERTVWAGLKAYGASAAVSVVDEPGLRTVLTPVAYEGFNAVFVGTCDEVAAVDDAYAATCEATVPLLWHLWSDAASVEAAVRSFGCRFYEEEPAMIAALEGNENLGRERSGLSIVDAESDEDVLEWARLLIGGDGALIDGVVSLRRGNPRFDHFLGLIDGQVVASAALFHGPEAAEVQHVVTKADFRRQGIGAAMTAAALARAFASGHTHAVLTASPDGFELYRRLGFRPVASVRRFIQQPAPARPDSPRR